MTPKEWEQFFVLLDKIVNGSGSEPGPWLGRATAALDAAKEHDGETALAETTS